MPTQTRWFQRKQLLLFLTAFLGLLRHIFSPWLCELPIYIFQPFSRDVISTSLPSSSQLPYCKTTIRRNKTIDTYALTHCIGLEVVASVLFEKLSCSQFMTKVSGGKEVEWRRFGCSRLRSADFFSPSFFFFHIHPCRFISNPTKLCHNFGNSKNLSK